MRTLCFLALVTRFAAAFPVIPSSFLSSLFIPVPPTEPAARLVAKIGWSKSDAFYGTAILLKEKDGRLYFMTNSHILPADRAKWPLLTLTGYATRFKVMEMKVVASAPGFDIAIVSVSVPKLIPTDKPPYAWDTAAEHFLPEIPDQKSWHVGVMGVPSHTADPRPFFRNVLWREEVKAMKNWTTTYDVVAASQLSVESIPITFKSICPPLFLNECFHIPLRTWGYSGGAFLVAPAGSPKNVKIAGIVSHFSPMAELTYVIPIRKAVSIAEHLLSKWDGKSVFVDLIDDSASFEYQSRHSVKVLRGPLKGEVVRQISARDQPGGGESSGGGGESSGGGGESSGGGGEGVPLHNRRPYLFVTDTTGSVSGLVNYRELSETYLRKPHEWHLDSNPFGLLFGLSPQFKGMDALFSYRPGIVVGLGDKRVEYQKYGETSLVNLQSFLQAFRKNDKLNLIKEFSRKAHPQYFSVAKDRAGLTSEWFMSPMKTLAEVRNVFSRAEIKINEMAMINIHAAQNGKLYDNPVDVVSGRMLPISGGTITRASLARDKGVVTLDYVCPRCGRTVVTFPDKFEQMGDDYYQYRGKIAFDNVDPVLDNQPTKLDDVWGIAVLKVNPETEHFEIKLGFVSQVPSEALNEDWRELNPFFSDKQELGFDAIYIPLDIEPKKISVALNKDEREGILKVIKDEKDFFEAKRRDNLLLAAAGGSATLPTRVGAIAEVRYTKEAYLQEIALGVGVTRDTLIKIQEFEREHAQEKQLLASCDELDKAIRPSEENYGFKVPPLKGDGEQRAKILQVRVAKVTETQDELIRMHETKFKITSPPKEKEVHKFLDSVNSRCKRIEIYADIQNRNPKWTTEQVIVAGRQYELAMDYIGNRLAEMIAAPTLLR